MNDPAIKPVVRTLIYVAIITASLMTALETIKQTSRESISIWESHIVTILFSTLVAVIVSFFALKRYYALLKILNGFLPICSKCKRIRTYNDHWVPIDQYVTDHSDVVFSHGLCSDCYEAYLEEYKRTFKTK